MVEIEYQLGDDAKSIASMEMKEVIRATAHNFPDPRFWPIQTGVGQPDRIDTHGYSMGGTADGAGSKPELAERLRAMGKNARVFEGVAFDLLAMVSGDVDRRGYFMVAAEEIVDMNAADPTIVRALARGLKQACDAGGFALINGETAELGYRTSRYGKTHVNWNAVGHYIIAPDKVISGVDLAPGQPIVALREKSIRSNGLTKAREILETAYLYQHGHKTKEEYATDWFLSHGVHPDSTTLVWELDELLGHNFLEQVLPPWHEDYPEITRQLLMPSRMYSPILYEAQGGVDGPRNVDMIAAAHITGGGVPEKTKRMLQVAGLGAHIDPIFPDPVGVQSLLYLVQTLPTEIQRRLDIDDAEACLQWNRGIGFLVVTRNKAEAQKLVALAEAQECEAGIAGEITDTPQITWRGHTWNYK